MRRASGRRSVADRVEADVPAAVKLVVGQRVVAGEDDDVGVFAVDHAGVLVCVHDGVGVGAGPDVVDGVVGVDEVGPVAGVDDGGLERRPAGGVVVAPDDVAGAAAVDRVVAVAAEQVVVDVLATDQRVVAPGGPLVHLEVLVGGPA